LSTQADNGTNKGAIQRFTTNGITSPFATSACVTPRGMAIDSAGNLYVANAFCNTIEKFTPNGIGSIFATNGLSWPHGLVVDKDGNVLVANWNSNTITKFTPAGVGSIFASNGVSAPFGLAVDSRGNVFVSNQGNNTIQKFTPDGVGSVFATYPGPSWVQFWGIGVDGSDNLFAILGGTIQKYTPDGVRSIFVREPSPLASPFGLAVDSAGNVYVANQGANNVVKFTPDGFASIFAEVGDNHPEFIIVQKVVSPPVLAIALGTDGNLLISSRVPARLQSATLLTCSNAAWRDEGAISGTITIQPARDEPARWYRAVQ
jgi:sugar lactone lactonase YvrE